MRRIRGQQGQLLGQPVVLFVTNCLTPYRQVMSNEWAPKARVAIAVALTMGHGDTERGWGDTRVSGKGWHVIPSVGSRDIGKNENVVQCVNRLAPEKIVTDLVKAVSLLTANGMVLVIMGQEGEQIAVQDLAHELGARCLCPGSKTQQELSAWYVTADVFALLSSEPWDPVIQEVMLSSLPVVSWDARDCSDTVHDGIDGWTFDRSDIAGLATGLERSLSSPNFLAKVGFTIVSDWNIARAGVSFADALRMARTGRA